MSWGYVLIIGGELEQFVRVQHDGTLIHEEHTVWVEGHEVPILHRVPTGDGVWHVRVGDWSRLECKRRVSRERPYNLLNWATERRARIATKREGGTCRS